MSEPRKEQLAEGITVYLADCRDVLPTMGSMAVAAVVTDPPYFGVKKDEWDNQWKDEDEFLSFIAEIAGKIYQILEPNGSLYHFASPQMAGRIERVIATKFNILNNIVWDKGASRKGSAGTGIDVGALRTYWSASSERVIFAEPLDRLTGSGCDVKAAKVSGYWDACQRVKASIIGDYLRSEFTRAGVGNKQIAALFPSRSGGMTGCVSNWLLGHNIPTEEQYESIRAFLNATGGEFLRREYEDLRREYEDLRREYEDLRRPFLLTSSDEWGDVWRFPIERNAEHPTQKPESMMTHIIKISTRPDGVVLDPFMGSGTTGVSCISLDRSFIGIEREPKYFDIACRRLSEAIGRPRLPFKESRKIVQEEMPI